jgi:glycosyltransferase involved in cell wall biosynthesis
MPTNPRFSIIIVSYDMAREVPRTIRSFLPPYQHAIAPDEVEILVMENGSPVPVPASVRAEFPDAVHWINVADPHPSPAFALNDGARRARGRWICPVIDGARMVTPGLLAKARQAGELSGEPFIASLGYHLGPKPQQISVAEGYDQAEEDRLLASIDWPVDGYRLFDIASLGLSARQGWFGPLAECNAPILRRSFYEHLGGFDEGFDLPGGGIVNHDFYKRAVEHPETTPVLLLGEGSFHQHHGGVTTSKGVDRPDDSLGGETPWQAYTRQYEALRGHAYAVPEVAPILFGGLSEPAKAALARCGQAYLETAS